MSEVDTLTEHATITTHRADGLGLLTSRVSGRDGIAAILTPWLDQVQELETAAWDLYALAIDSSADHALDQLGVILGQPRPDGMADEPYQRVLRGVALALRSSGTGDDVERVTHAVLGAWATVTEAFPAALVVRPVSEPDVPATVVASVLKRAKAGGVQVQVIDVGPTPRFRFSSSAEEVVASSSSGLGDSTGAVSGGELVGVVRA